jgi:hypothetical protein
MTHFGIPRRPLGVPQPETTPINWRRGLLRVWLLLSAAWMMGWIVYLTISGLQGAFQKWSDLLWMAVLLLGPPVALLLFGLGAGWAFRGFNPDEDRANR